MKNFIVFIIIIACICQVAYSQQDVIIFVQAKQLSNGLSLDTILIENLSNGTNANIYNLPQGVSNYEINLSQGAEVNSIAQIAEQTTNFKLISNQPGLSSFSIKSMCTDFLYLELFNIHGQSLYKTTEQIVVGTNTFDFLNNYPSIGILSLKTSKDKYSIKVIGAESQITKLSLSNLNDQNLIAKNKSLKTDFLYNNGDSIRITAKKQHYHSNSIVLVPENSGNYIIYLSQPCPGIATVTDYDGNIYNTVKIGNQCWLKENLKTTHYSDGTALTDGSSTGIGGSNVYLKIFYNYSDNNSLTEITGKLYTWAAAINGYVSNNDDLIHGHRQGLCPNGWHIPSDEEWVELELFVDNSINEPYIFGDRGTDIGINLKSNSYWQNTTSSDMHGFSALPGGHKEVNILNNSFVYSGYYTKASFWTSSHYQGNGITRHLNNDSSKIWRGNRNPSHAYSVRCIKD